MPAQSCWFDHLRSEQSLQLIKVYCRNVHIWIFCGNKSCTSTWHILYYSSFQLTSLEKRLFPNITSSSQPLQKCKISLPLYSLSFILSQFTCGPAGILIGSQSNIFCSECGRSESFDTTGIRSTFWSCRAFAIAHQWPEAWQWEVREHSEQSSASTLRWRKGAFCLCRCSVVDRRIRQCCVCVFTLSLCADFQTLSFKVSLCGCDSSTPITSATDTTAMEMWLYNTCQRKPVLLSNSRSAVARYRGVFLADEKDECVCVYVENLFVHCLLGNTSQSPPPVGAHITFEQLLKAQYSSPSGAMRHVHKRTSSLSSPCDQIFRVSLFFPHPLIRIDLFI